MRPLGECFARRRGKGDLYYSWAHFERLGGGGDSRCAWARCGRTPTSSAARSCWSGTQLPPYAPHLNPVEGIRSVLRRTTQANRVFTTSRV
jgi:hypothetical protein